MHSKFKNIVVLTGAGISAESGIPVFRSETGLWESEKIEDVCVPSALIRNPRKVHEFYSRMRLSLQSRKPNPAHEAVALLQEKWPSFGGGSVTLVTQNIDDLHEKAGSCDVIHMHGELNSMLCSKCHGRWAKSDASSPEDVCPLCKSSGTTRPDIVFFEEMPYHMDLIEERLAKCDLFAAVGTSGVVYPAAGFCSFARSVGALCVEFNLERSAVGSQFDYGLYGKASETLTAFVKRLLEDGTALSEI